MKKNFARLQSVTAHPALTLGVRYSDGRSFRVDLGGVVARRQAFAPLENADEFAAVKVSDFGWSLEWPCGASLDSDRVLELAMEQAGMAENVRFRHWQDSLGLSLSSVAQALGMTRRTISQYRTGARPVPRYIALACKGYELTRKSPTLKASSHH